MTTRPEQVPGMPQQHLDLTRAAWRKSTHSNNGGECVEVATNLPGLIAVRDSKHPNGPVLTFTPTEWDAFLHGVIDGEFNQPTT